jgi:hypothetical protein
MSAEHRLARSPGRYRLVRQNPSQLRHLVEHDDPDKEDQDPRGDHCAEGNAADLVLLHERPPHGDWPRDKQYGVLGEAEYLSPNGPEASAARSAAVADDHTLHR